MTLIAVLVAAAFVLNSGIVRKAVPFESAVVYPTVLVTLLVLLQMGRLA